MTGRENEKHGASVSVGCQALEDYGLCSEDRWPYEPRDSLLRPPDDCYDEADYHKIHTPAQIDNNNIDHLKDSLAQGKPFVVGIVTYSELKDDEARETGDVPLPGDYSEKLGHHAVLVVGYDDDDERWIVRNSWGPDWGDRG